MIKLKILILSLLILSIRCELNASEEKTESEGKTEIEHRPSSISPLTIRDLLKLYDLTQKDIDFFNKGIAGLLADPKVTLDDPKIRQHLEIARKIDHAFDSIIRSDDHIKFEMLIKLFPIKSDILRTIPRKILLLMSEHFNHNVIDSKKLEIFISEDGRMPGIFYPKIFIDLQSMGRISDYQLLDALIDLLKPIETIVHNSLGKASEIEEILDELILYYPGIIETMDYVLYGIDFLQTRFAKYPKKIFIAYKIGYFFKFYQSLLEAKKFLPKDWEIGYLKYIHQIQTEGKSYVDIKKEEAAKKF